MSTNRGVQTRAIKEAVKGRETEILDALQIDRGSGQLPMQLQNAHAFFSSHRQLGWTSA